MVQGLTNSINSIQQGGGDIVYAVNQTGSDLVDGDKVWLNVAEKEGKWIATTFDKVSELTITGIATGRLNDNGLNEVKTVLPSKVLLTFNVEPDPDLFILTGIVA